MAQVRRTAKDLRILCSGEVTDRGPFDQKHIRLGLEVYPYTQSDFPSYQQYNKAARSHKKENSARCRRLESHGWISDWQPDNGWWAVPTQTGWALRDHWNRDEPDNVRHFLREAKLQWEVRHESDAYTLERMTKIACRECDATMTPAELTSNSDRLSLDGHQVVCPRCNESLATWTCDVEVEVENTTEWGWIDN
jgi:hypothetical protein